MQIGSYIPRYSMPLERRTQTTGASKAAGPEKAPEKEDFSSHFSGPDDVIVTRTPSGGTQYQMFSPGMRLEDQWERWRAQLGGDPDADLPDSTGWTEENIAYLKERFSGELTWVERQDALETMRKLGMISGNQISISHGGGMCTLKATQLGNGCYVASNTSDPGFQKMLDKMKADVLNPKNPLERDWNVLFQGDPIAGFLTIDDILNWAKELPDDTFDPWRLIMEQSGQITE